MGGLDLRLVFCIISLLWLSVFVSGKNVLVQQEKHSDDGCTFPDGLPITVLRGGNDDVSIPLIKNTVVTVPTRVVFMKTDDVSGETIYDYKELPTSSVAYHSPITDHEACFVVKCLKDKKKNSLPFYTFNGTFSIGDDKYQLSPSHEQVIIENGHIKQGYTMEHLQNDGSAALVDFIESLDQPLKKSRAARKPMSIERQTGSNTTNTPIHYYMDIMPVIDYKLYTRFLERNVDNLENLALDIATYYTNVFTGISLRYATLELHDNIRLITAIVTPFISTDVSTSWFTEENKISSFRGTYVHIYNQRADFTQWVNETQDLPYHDHAMLFTGYSWYSTDGYGKIGGVALLERFCNQQGESVSIVQDMLAYRNEHIAAHELGHSLGAYHDGVHNSCDGEDHYIMSAYIPSRLNENNFRNPHNFSSCSTEEISLYIETLEEDSEVRDSCLLAEYGHVVPDEPVFSYNHIESLCSVLHGNTSSLCWHDGYGDRYYGALPLTAPYVCGSMFCEEDEHSCTHLIPPTGTCCGNGKRCIAGACVEAPTGHCDLDDECPFQDQPDCLSVIVKDVAKCLDEYWVSFCCTFCKDLEINATPPPDPPKVTLNGVNVTDGQNLTLVTGGARYVYVRVSVQGGIPEVSSVTLECENVQHTKEGSSLEFHIYVGLIPLFPMSCVASASHYTGLYNKTTSFTVTLAPEPPDYPPRVCIGDDNNCFLGNSNRTVTVYLNQTIKVLAEIFGGVPQVSNITLQCEGLDTRTREGAGVYFNINTTSGYEYEFPLRCVVYAEHITGLYNLTTSFTLQLHEQCPYQDRQDCRYLELFKCFQDDWEDFCCSFCSEIRTKVRPPELPPSVILDNDSLRDNENVTVYQNDTIRFIAYVYGGVPEVSNLTLECDGFIIAREEYYGLNFYLTTSDYEFPMRCVVYAEHMTGLYNLTTSFTLQLHDKCSRHDYYYCEYYYWWKCFEDPSWFEQCCTYCTNAMDQVEIPPDPPLVFVNEVPINASDTIKADMNETLIVHVLVDDGDPEVSTITLDCDDSSNKTTKERIWATFHFTATFDLGYLVRCVVSAEHITGMYNLTTSFFIELRPFPPTDAPEIHVNNALISNDDDVTVDLAGTLTITCAVRGGYPEVTNVTVGCTGQESTTSNGTVVLEMPGATQQMNEAKCQCWAGHVTGKYHLTTAFTLDVIAEPAMRLYTMNNNTITDPGPIQVTAGDSIDVVCQAFGMPAPGLTITYMDKGADMGGKLQALSETDHYTNVIRKTWSVACADSGRYQCVADNGVKSKVDEILSLKVLCPAQMDDTAVIPPPRVSSMGLTEISLQVNSDPAIKDFELSKYRRTAAAIVNDWSTSGRRRRDTEDARLVKTFAPGDFLVNVEYADGVNDISVSTFDPDPCAHCFFAMKMSNGVGPALTVEFDSPMNSGGSVTRTKAGPDSGLGSAVSLYSVSALSILFLILLIVGFIVYTRVYRNQTNLVKKKKRLSVRNRTQLWPHPMAPRVWMTNPSLQSV